MYCYLHQLLLWGSSDTNPSNANLLIKLMKYNFNFAVIGAYLSEQNYSYVQYKYYARFEVTK